MMAHQRSQLRRKKFYSYLSCYVLFFSSSIFPVDLPKGAVWGAPPGPTNMSTDAVYLMIPPLSKGEHTLHFSGQVFNPTDPTYNQATDLTYHLIVKLL